MILKNYGYGLIPFQMCPLAVGFRDFGSFKIVGEGPNPLSFLDSEQVPYGEEIHAEAEADSTAD
jgi:hypothetical protein